MLMMYFFTHHVLTFLAYLVFDSLKASFSFVSELFFSHNRIPANHPQARDTLITSS